MVPDVRMTVAVNYNKKLQLENIINKTKFPFIQSNIAIFEYSSVIENHLQRIWGAKFKSTDYWWLLPDLQAYDRVRRKGLFIKIHE